MLSFVFYTLACNDVEKIVKPLGFKRNNRFFYRITEDGVVQQFCLLCLRDSFTIRFTLNSVFGDNDITKEGSEVSSIIDGTNRWIGESFDMGNMNGMTVFYHKKLSYKESVDICTEVLNDVLLPFFEKTRDIKNAHDNMLEYDSLVKNDTKDFDTREIGFCLQEGNYEKVKEILEFYIENKKEWNIKWWAEKESEFQELYNAIINNDTEYIQEYMKTKKKRTYSQLKIRDDVKRK